jgi:predicted amidohydrolase YtcJ
VQAVTSTLYRNGVIHSSADPFAEALLVDGGVVSWLGSEDTAAGLAARADRVVDLDGALVTPGFVDAHVHVLETGLALESVDLTAAHVDSRAAALDALHAGAHRLDAADPDGDEVLLAFGWDEQAWSDRRSLTREELDAACAEISRRYPDAVPRPPHWGGLRVVPGAVEFWQGRPGRMHDRLVYRRSGGGWTVERLAP